MPTPKAGPPVVGFNHNVKYGPRVYHVQTEDSGLPHAHYITHLFVGGNIVASMKSSYVEKAAEPDLPKVVRGLMEQQHKTMLTRPTTPPRLAPVVPSPARPAAPAAAKAAQAPSFFSDSPVETPTDDLPTLFAEELISEKSLDEVILAFLSADLEPPK